MPGGTVWSLQDLSGRALRSGRAGIGHRCGIGQYAYHTDALGHVLTVGSGDQSAVQMDMGVKHHIAGFGNLGFSIGRTPLQIDLAIGSAVDMDVLMRGGRMGRTMVVRIDFMRMRCRPGHRSETSQHGNQEKSQSLPHCPQGAFRSGASTCRAPPGQARACPQYCPDGRARHQVSAARNRQAARSCRVSAGNPSSTS